MSTETVAPLPDLIGRVAMGEYERSTDGGRAQIESWARDLRAMLDDEFQLWTAGAIHGSAILQGFRGNYEAEHCKTSAAHHEAKRRHLAAGHDEDCHGSNLYALAFRSVWIGQGHSPRSYPVKPCDCGRVSGDVDTAPET